MRIRKLGRCCLHIQEKEVSILTDPGSFTIESVKEISGLDLILITDERSDHLHIDSLKTLLKNNPHAKIFTQYAVRAILKREGMESELLLDARKVAIKGVLIDP